MPTATLDQEIQTMQIIKEEMIDAPIEIVFQAMLDELGPESQMPDGTPMPLKLEPWPGGRWFRDLGNNAGHFWGHVQVIKPPQAAGDLRTDGDVVPRGQSHSIPIDRGRRPHASQTHAQVDGLHPTRASRRHAGRLGAVDQADS